MINTAKPISLNKGLFTTTNDDLNNSTQTDTLENIAPLRLNGAYHPLSISTALSYNRVSIAVNKHYSTNTL